MVHRGGGGCRPRLSRRPEGPRVLHKGPVLVVKVDDLGGRGEGDVEAVAAQLVAGLAPEAAHEVLGGHARDVQGELLVAVPAKDKVCITTGYFIEKL